MGPCIFLVVVLLLFGGPHSAAPLAAYKGLQGAVSGVHTPERKGSIHSRVASAFLTRSAAAVAAAAATSAARGAAPLERRAAEASEARAAKAASAVRAAAAGSAAEVAADGKFPVWSLSDLPTPDSLLLAAAATAANKHKVRDIVCFVRCAAWQRPAEEYESERLLLQQKRGPLLSPHNKPVSSTRCLTPDYLNDVEETIPDTVPESIPDTIPESIPDTIPDTIPDSIPETIPKAIPETIPEMIPETIADSISRRLRRKKEDLLRAEWEAMLLVTCLGPTHIDSVAETLIQ
ncbi:hypothetical protein, conserved, partial [Eimeria acervulina]